MKNLNWLQFFAEGGAPAGEGDGGATAGETGSPAAAGQESEQSTLEKLGVPKDKAAKFAASMKRRGMETKGQTQTVAPVTSSDAPDSGAAPAQPKPTWDDILKDPEYKKAFDEQVQGIIQKRFRSTMEREQRYDELNPALEMLAKKYGKDIGDFKGLAQAIVDDDELYKDRAATMGVDVKTAKELTQNEIELTKLRDFRENNIRAQQVRDHMDRLNAQANELRAEFPDFSLEREMQNDTFVRLTAPNSGLSVKDAFYAIHHKEIEAARQQKLTQQAMAAATASVRAGQSRPKENGSTTPATITRVPPAQRSKAEREELKRRINAAAANGKKLPIDF